MRQHKRLWNIICLMMALSTFFVVMVEARPNQFAFFPKFLKAKKHRHILTEVRHSPDLAFFWSMSQKVNQDNLGLSERQKTLIEEEFWKLFRETIAVQYEALSREQRTPEKAISVLSTNAFVPPLQLETILAEYVKAIHHIFTSEQHKKLRKRRAAIKMFVKLQTSLEFRAFAFTPTASTVNALVQLHYDGVEETSGVTSQPLWANLVQVHPQAYFFHNLHQLQILRL